jgi:hypothetical protein
VQLDRVERRLHKTELADRRDVEAHIGGDRGEHALAVRRAQHVARPAGDLLEHRQPASCRAGAAGHCVVTLLVPDQRHGEIVERGDDHPPGLARRARRAVVAEQLNQDMLRVHVIVLVARALERQQAEFLAAVGVDHLGFPD